MQNKTKTFIFILIIFTLILGALLGGYFFFVADRGAGPKDTAEDKIKNIFDNFFPFGSEPSAEQTGIVEETFDEPEADASVPRLRRVSSFPVAGAISFEDEDNETVIRFISRETGHIYETKTDSLTQERISNTTIPRIQKARWSQNGRELIIQYLDDENEQVESFYAALDIDEDALEDKGGSLIGTFLPKGIIDFAISDDNKLFYLIKSGDGSVGIISGLDGSDKTQVFNSRLSQWMAQWQRGNVIYLVAKPSADADGFLYFLNGKTEKFDKILGAGKGLTASVSPDGKLVLFASNIAGAPILSALNIGTGGIKDLPLWTMPEKCVWSEMDSAKVYCGIPNRTPSGSLPDVWYQGLESFSDSVWIINTEDGTADLIVDSTDGGFADMDIIQPSLSPDEDYLIFINKNDSTLWSLEL